MIELSSPLSSMEFVQPFSKVAKKDNYFEIIALARREDGVRQNYLSLKNANL